MRKRPEFERVYAEGVRIHGRFMTVFVVPGGEGRSRLGVAATRKMGGAVVRNRAKRLARELFRRHRLEASLDIVIVPRREMVDAPFASLEADYLAALERRDRERPRPASARPRGRGRNARSAPRV